MKAVFAARGRPRQQSRERFWTGQFHSLHCCVVHGIGRLHCTPQAVMRAASNLNGVVGPREADSEGEAKDHKRQAQHGVEGGAPHRAEAFVAIQYEDAGKKANLHL